LEQTLWAVTDGARDHVALIAPQRGAVVFEIALGLCAERLALDENARFVAAAAADGRVAVWDLRLRTQLAVAASAAVAPVFLQVDEGEVTLVCADGMLHALSMPDLAPSWRARLADGVVAAEICGPIYALCGDAVRVLEAGRPDADGVATVRATRELGVHPGGRRVVRSPVRSVGVAGGDRLRLWSTDDGHAVAEVALPDVVDFGFVTSNKGNQGGERLVALTRRALHALGMEGPPLWTRPLEDDAAALLVGSHLGVLSAAGRLAIFNLRGKPTGAIEGREGWAGAVTATALDAGETLKRLGQVGDPTVALIAKVCRLLLGRGDAATQGLIDLEGAHPQLWDLMAGAWRAGRLDAPAERAALAGWLGDRDSAAARAALRGGLADPDAGVRKVCKGVLERLGELAVPPTALLPPVDLDALAAGARRDPAVRALLLDRLAPAPQPGDAWAAEPPGAPRTLASLAALVGLSPELVDAELAALHADRRSDRKLAKRLGLRHLRRHPGAWSLGFEGVHECLRAPDPYDIERWVATAAYHPLDGALAAVKMRPHALTATAPRLGWADGAPLSAGAQAWYLAHLLAEQTYGQGNADGHRLPVRGAAALIEPALAPGSRLALAQWVLAQTLPKSLAATVPGGDDAVIDWVGGEVEAGRLDRRRAEALRGLHGPQWLRWRYRWAQLRGGRSASPLVQDAGIEARWPSGDDATGDATQWRAWIGAALQRAMRWQRPWRLAHFAAAYLRQPLAAPLAAGLVYAVAGQRVCFLDGHAHDASGAPVPLAADTELTVAHPADGAAGWPTPPAPPPFDQRGARLFEADELPALPDAPIPHATWKARCNALGLLAAGGYGGGTVGEELRFEPFTLRFGHAGYGSGYGGKRPITGVNVAVQRLGHDLARLDADGATGWDTLPAWLRCESVAATRIMLGADPPS
jgi:hypothetical protein